MFEMPILISILVFTGVFLFFAALLLLAKYTGTQKDVLRKLRTGTMVDAKESEENLSTSGRIRRYFSNWLFSLGQWAKPKKESDLSRVEKDMLRAGYRSSNAVIFYFGTKVLLSLILPALVLFLVFYMRRPSPAMYIITLLVLFAVIGFFLPNLFLWFKISRRKAKFIEGFPDALDLMVVCVEAGMGWMQR